jgi:hypothetical protein
MTEEEPMEGIIAEGKSLKCDSSKNDTAPRRCCGDLITVLMY